MKIYYVIKNNNYYVSHNEELTNNIKDAYEFKSEYFAINYANNHFYPCDTFIIEKVYKII